MTEDEIDKMTVAEMEARLADIDKEKEKLEYLGRLRRRLDKRLQGASTHEGFMANEEEYQRDLQEEWALQDQKKDKQCHTP